MGYCPVAVLSEARTVSCKLFSCVQDEVIVTVVCDSTVLCHTVCFLSNHFNTYLWHESPLDSEERQFEAELANS